MQRIGVLIEKWYSFQLYTTVDQQDRLMHQHCTFYARALVGKKSCASQQQFWSVNFSSFSLKFEVPLTERCTILLRFAILVNRELGEHQGLGTGHSVQRIGVHTYQCVCNAHRTRDSVRNNFTQHYNACCTLDNMRCLTTHKQVDDQNLRQQI